MTTRKTYFTSADMATWPEFDPSALKPAQQDHFHRRRAALEGYANGETLGQIEAHTRIHRKQLYRLVDRCTQVHPDGRAFGFRALVRYTHVNPYDRIRPFKSDGRSGFGFAAGAFGLLLQAHPTLASWLKDQVKHKRVSLVQANTNGQLRVRLRNLVNIHRAFLGECRRIGIAACDYPFNTERMAIRALSCALRNECLESFSRASSLAGSSHLKGWPDEKSATLAPAATQFLDVVEFDGHRLDLRLCVVVKDAMGFEQQFDIERIWLLVIIDVWSRCVLGYHLSLNHEYNRYDIIRTIEAALEPHRPMTFTLPGVGYGPLGGFPSTKLPELAFATWQRFKLDNARANLSADVRHALVDFVGCTVDAGPPHSPDDRPYIERFFGSISSHLSSRLPGYTGSHPKDVRRALSDTKSNFRLQVSLAEIEELVEAAIAGYNASPHDGLNGRTPLEAVEHCVRTRAAMINWLPEAKRRTLCLMQTPKRATVRGYINQGQRPHVNFYGVRYTNAVLASTATLLGQELHLYYNSRDLRTVRAFTSQGSELGVLTAQGTWGEVTHDIKIRQKIIKLRAKNRLRSGLSHEFLERFIQAKFTQAKGSRRAASNLTQTLKVMGATGGKADAEATPPTHDQGCELAGQVPLGHPIEAVPLSIGSGYVGVFWPR